MFTQWVYALKSSATSFDHLFSNSLNKDIVALSTLHSMESADNERNFHSFILMFYIEAYMTYSLEVQLIKLSVSENSVKLPRELQKRLFLRHLTAISGLRYRLWIDLSCVFIFSDNKA